MNAASESSKRSSLQREAVAFYDHLLADEDIASATFRSLHDCLEHKKLIFGGRPLSPYLRPHFITREDLTRHKTAYEIIWSALQKVKDAAVRDDKLLAELGIAGIEKELVRIE